METIKKFIPRVIGYVRYRAKELRNIYTTTEQEEEIKNYACENVCKVLEIFSDNNKSGKTFTRPGLQAMLKYIEANPRKINKLIVSDVTRLSTNSEKFKSIKRFLNDRGVKLISLVHRMPKGSRDSGEQAKQQF